MWVGIVPSIEDPNRAKVWVRGGFEVSAWWWSWDIGLAYLDWDLHHHLFWFPDLVIWTRIDTAVFPACRWQIMGFSSCEPMSCNKSISLCVISVFFRAFLVAQWWRICLLMQETRVWFLVWEDPLKKEMATHSSILVFFPGESPWTQEGPKRVRHNLAIEQKQQSFSISITYWLCYSREL